MNNHKKNWYVARWPFLAWLETVIKLVALGIGIAAFVRSVSLGGLMLPVGIQLVQFIGLGFLSLGLLVAISSRLKEREIVAMVFVIINNLGHWGMTISLASKYPVHNSLLAFCSLMLIGDLVKIVFIRVHHFSVRDLPWKVVFGLISIYLFGYAAILILEFMR